MDSGQPFCQKGRILAAYITPAYLQQPPELFFSQTVQPCPDAPSLFMKVRVVVSYQLHHRINGFFIEFQPFHYLFRNPGAYRAMSIEMPSAVLILSIAFRFSDIMKQYGQCHNRIISCRSEGRCGMLPHIVDMIRIILLKSAHGP